jgi:uncharacterized protein YheU (UPF0270 family)
MEIPHSSLDPETLQQLIEAYVLREGTDYGHKDVRLEDKVRQVMRQLEKNEAKIVFDPDTQSVNIILTR